MEEYEDVTQTGHLPQFEPEVRPSRLPWILLALVTVLGLVVGGLSWVRASSLAAKVNEAAEAEAKAQNELTTKAGQLQASELERMALEQQVKGLTADKELLTQQVAALEEEVTKAKAAAAAAAEAKPVSKAKKKSGKRRRR